MSMFATQQTQAPSAGYGYAQGPAPGGANAFNTYQQTSYPPQGPPQAYEEHFQQKTTDPVLAPGQPGAGAYPQQQQPIEGAPQSYYVSNDPVLKVQPAQSWGEWFTGKQPAAKSPAELRDEKYVIFICAMDKIFANWESNHLSKEQALSEVEVIMNKIKTIGRVDGERARFLLEKEGINDQRRMDLEREYEDLKRQCGQQVQPMGYPGAVQDYAAQQAAEASGSPFATAFATGKKGQYQQAHQRPQRKQQFGCF